MRNIVIVVLKFDVGALNIDGEVLSRCEAVSDIFSI